MATGSSEATPDPSAVVAAFLAVWLLGALGSSVPLVVAGDQGGATPIPLLGVVLATGWAAMLAAVWLVSSRIGTGDVRRDVGLAARPVDLAGLVIGSIAQLALVPLVYLPLQVIWSDTFDGDRLGETARDLVDRADGAQVALLFVLVALGAPVVEEIVYRGMLQRPLLHSLPPAAVVVGVAAVFAVIHFRPVEYPGLFAAGLVFGVCAWRTGRLGMAMAAHIGFNVTGLLLAL